jgi:hypothetical protein
MKLSDQQLQALQMLYKKHFNIDLSQQEVLERGVRLVRMFELALKHKHYKSTQNNNRANLQSNYNDTAIQTDVTTTTG